VKKFLFSEITNFIDTEQQIDIARTVFELKDSWKWIGDYPKYKPLGEDLCENQYLLGDAIYCLYDKDFEGVDQTVRNILLEKLATLYNVLFEKLPKHFGADITGISFFPTLPVPGFHVFHGKGEDEEPFEWHQDTTLVRWLDGIDQSRIYSYTSPIILPKSGGTLEWVGALNKENTVVYEYGKLHIWQGLLKHRIGRHTIAEGESRITFQGHVYIDNNKHMNLFF
jgi:hypothetical protein